MKSAFASTFPLKETVIGGVCVFYEETFENLLEHFSKEKAKYYVHLLHEAQIHPKMAYQEVLKLQGESSNPLLDNLLTYLHLQNKEGDKAEKLIEESYKNYPNYLFAKINYADQCLRKKELDKIPSIFPSFDLRELFPDKKKFHVSEYRGFMVLACRYHRLIKHKEKAKEYYECAYLADPSHPSVVLLEKASMLGSLAHKCLLLFRKFFKLCQAILLRLWPKRSGIPSP